MVFCMAYAMICYNHAIHAGGLTPSVFVEAFRELPIIAVIAFLIEFFIVGKLAIKCGLRMVNPETEHPYHMILAVSSATIAIMCPIEVFISLLIFNNPGLCPEFFTTWIQSYIISFPMALLWQIFVAGPFVRLVFRLIFERKHKSVHATSQQEVYES